ncbi:MAG: ABC transporter ATP-binding protein [Thermodesulfobacteriota bacterium]|nr:ABC transporter ATP-binding protein [Thermodesulfobacteriota bacterium]
MWGEYGYMEEGQLGKPYNLSLLKRLAQYALPYKKTISLGLSLSILITLLELVLPYLSKIAIDRYILSSWYKVNITATGSVLRQNMVKRYGHLFEKSDDGTHFIISHMDIQEIDPAILQEYRNKGIVSQKRFYRIQPETQNKSTAISQGRESIRMPDGSFVVPHEDLSNLTSGEILKIREKDVRGLAIIGIVLMALLLISFGISYAEYYLLELTGQSIMQDIRLQLFQRMQSQAMSFFDRHPVGRLVTRVTNDIENLNEMFKSVIITVFKDLFILSGILVVLLYLNWRLALVSFIILPFIFGLTLLFSSLARDAFRELRRKVAKINAFLQERLSGMRIIQLFVTEKFQMEAFSRINHENYLASMKQIRLFAVFMPVMELLSSFAVALVIWHGGGKVIGEQLTLGSLVAFISYIQMFFKPIRDISEKYNIMQSAMASTERIMEFMDHREEILEPAKPVRPPQVTGHLQFKDVSFAYSKDHPVLHDVSFEVKPGEMVAVVGATGAGKTTIVKLIERFYDPDKGSILFEGIDIRKWSKKELRSHIGLVMQDVFIFAGSLKDNISMGQESISMEAINQAARQANATGLIRRMPDGLHQEVGEEGSNLSGGERQLLSFARALAYDPTVLILDEATSSVDPETERLIQAAIFKITKSRTTLVIAHRLSTVQNADHILVMHHGRICEQGTHKELMALGGIYYKLNKLRKV